MTTNVRKRKLELQHSTAKIEKLVDGTAAMRLNGGSACSSSGRWRDQLQSDVGANEATATWPVIKHNVFTEKFTEQDNCSGVAQFVELVVPCPIKSSWAFLKIDGVNLPVLSRRDVGGASAGRVTQLVPTALAERLLLGREFGPVGDMLDENHVNVETPTHIEAQMFDRLEMPTEARDTISSTEFNTKNTGPSTGATSSSSDSEPQGSKVESARSAVDLRGENVKLAELSTVTKLHWQLKIDSLQKMCDIYTFLAGTVGEGSSSPFGQFLRRFAIELNVQTLSARVASRQRAKDAESSDP